MVAVSVNEYVGDTSLAGYYEVSFFVFFDFAQDGVELRVRGCGGIPRRAVCVETLILNRVARYDCRRRGVPHRSIMGHGFWKGRSGVTALVFSQSFSFVFFWNASAKKSRQFPIPHPPFFLFHHERRERAWRTFAWGTSTPADSKRVRCTVKADTNG